MSAEPRDLSWLNAEADVRYRFSCGCRWATEPGERAKATNTRNVGNVVECDRHGPVRIVEALFTLVEGTRELDRVRLGGRNFVRPGDLVHVEARPGKRDGYDTRVLRIMEHPGERIEVEVGPDKRGAVRTYPLDRLRRRARTRTQEARP